MSSNSNKKGYTDGGGAARKLNLTYKDFKNVKVVSKNDIQNVKNTKSSNYRTNSSRTNQQMNNEKKEDQRWEFENALKIKLANIVRVEDIIDAISALIGDIKNVAAISQFKNNKTWIVSLKENLKNEAYFKQKVKVLNEETIIMDPNYSNPFFVATLRFHWLPHGFPIDFCGEVVKHKVKGIESLEVEKEHYKNEKFNHLENGVIRVKVSCVKESKNEIINIQGITKIRDFRSLITVVGQPKTCIFCDQTGHIQKECTLAKLTCAKCNFKGHDEKNCTYAEKLKAINRLNK